VSHSREQIALSTQQNTFWPTKIDFAIPFLRRMTAPCGRCRAEPTASALGRRAHLCVLGNGKGRQAPTNHPDTTLL
jgi:hypothetical protein